MFHVLYGIMSPHVIAEKQFETVAGFQMVPVNVGSLFSMVSIRAIGYVGSRGPCVQRGHVVSVGS